MGPSLSPKGRGKSIAGGLAACLLVSTAVAAPPDPLATAALLRDRALAGSAAYPFVEALTTEVGPRLGGTEAEHRAADWAVDRLKAMGFENVHIESFPMTAWVRGIETAEVVAPYPQRLAVTALGNSVATPPDGITADMALFPTYADLLAAAPGSLAGKIAVVTQKMVRTQDGSGYGALYPARGDGASEAARRSAVAYLVRSLGTEAGRLPHTGALRYAADAPRIPAAALSTADAEQLDHMAARGHPVRLHLVLTPTVRDDAQGRTVVADLVGREHPDQIVLIGGHLDSWDLGTGAIDDGAGIAITTAAAKLIAGLPSRPRRTIRIVLFGAEELAQSGPAFAKAHGADEQAHIVIAAEADFGAEPVYEVRLPANAAPSPWGKELAAALAPLGAFVTESPATRGGADLEGLQGVPLVQLRQDGSRYFDIHHTADDTLDKIDRRALDRAVAAWAVFVDLAADSDVDFRALAAAAPGNGK